MISFADIQDDVFCQFAIPKTLNRIHLAQSPSQVRGVGDLEAGQELREQQLPVMTISGTLLQSGMDCADWDLPRSIAFISRRSTSSDMSERQRFLCLSSSREGEGSWSEGAAFRDIRLDQ